MLISVFLIWETTLIKFKSSFSPKARKNLPIIDRIIEDTRFFFAFFDFSPKFEQKKFQTFTFLRRRFKIRARSGDPWDSVIRQSLSFQDNSCYEKHNAKETIDEMQSAVNRGY